MSAHDVLERNRGGFTFYDFAKLAVSSFATSFMNFMFYYALPVLIGGLPLWILLYMLN